MFLHSADKHGREAEKDLDLRIRRTHRVIRFGLVRVCQARPYVHVGAIDIYAASMISRTTLYDHCTDRGTLLVEVVPFLLKEVIPAPEGLWSDEEHDVHIVAQYLADMYMRNG